MAVIGWGKPRIFVKDLDATSPKWEELPTPVENSTQETVLYTYILLHINTL